MHFKVIRLPCKPGIVGGSDNLNPRSPPPTGKVRAQQRTIYQSISSIQPHDSVTPHLSPSLIPADSPVRLGTPRPPA